MTPIFQTSTYVQDAPGVHKGFEYARTQNPTRTTLEKNIAALKMHNMADASASGMSATEDGHQDFTSWWTRWSARETSMEEAFGLFTQIYEEFGIKFTFVDMRDISNVEAAMTDKTKLVWGGDSNKPMLNVVDIAAVSEIAHAKGAKVVVDNTFASPYFQNPLGSWSRCGYAFGN